MSHPTTLLFLLVLIAVITGDRGLNGIISCAKVNKDDRGILYVDVNTTLKCNCSCISNKNCTHSSLIFWTYNNINYASTKILDNRSVEVEISNLNITEKDHLFCKGEKGVMAAVVIYVGNAPGTLNDIEIEVIDFVTTIVSWKIPENHEKIKSNFSVEKPHSILLACDKSRCSFSTPNVYSTIQSFHIKEINIIGEHTGIYPYSPKDNLILTPPNITVHSYNHQSITLTLNETCKSLVLCRLHAKQIVHEISYYEEDNASEFKSIIYNCTYGKNIEIQELQNLKSYEIYHIGARSKASKWGNWENISLQTLPDVPSIVSNVQITGEDMVNLSWDAPLLPNGPLNYYLIFIEENGLALPNFTSEKNKYERKIECNKNQTKYCFKVAAVNKRNQIDLIGPPSNQTCKAFCISKKVTSPSLDFTKLIAVPIASLIGVLCLTLLISYRIKKAYFVMLNIKLPEKIEDGNQNEADDYHAVDSQLENTEVMPDCISIGDLDIEYRLDGDYLSYKSQRVMSDTNAQANDLNQIELAFYSTIGINKNIQSNPDDNLEINSNAQSNHKVYDSSEKARTKERESISVSDDKQDNEDISLNDNKKLQCPPYIHVHNFKESSFINSEGAFCHRNVDTEDKSKDKLSKGMLKESYEGITSTEVNQTLKESLHNNHYCETLADGNVNYISHQLINNICKSANQLESVQCLSNEDEIKQIDKISENISSSFDSNTTKSPLPYITLSMDVDPNKNAALNACTEINSEQSTITSYIPQDNLINIQMPPSPCENEISEYFSLTDKNTTLIDPLKITQLDYSSSMPESGYSEVTKLYQQKPNDEVTFSNKLNAKTDIIKNDKDNFFSNIPLKQYISIQPSTSTMENNFEYSHVTLI